MVFAVEATIGAETAGAGAVTGTEGIGAETIGAGTDGTGVGAGTVRCR